ncbi:ESPR domain-containing protein [Acinetobacter seifertii]|uniref:ESPR domain-containing protein n=1 Tax=Acinetobacter seifertii TaxID=1530123 RepID=UPI0027DD579E|nr:ESPR domain-containing protein [Acinetobacter seifertii]
MNKIYKVVWNASLSIWVVVSELVKGKTKSSKNNLSDVDDLSEIKIESSGLLLFRSPALKLILLSTAGFVSQPTFANLAVCGSTNSGSTNGSVVGNVTSTATAANCGAGTAVATSGIGGAIAIGDNQSNPTIAQGNDNLAIMSGATATSGGLIQLVTISRSVIMQKQPPL